MMRRLVLMVEGEGDEKAVPTLVQRVLERLGATGLLYLDGNPLKNLSLPKLARNDFAEWRRMLAYAARRNDVGAILLLLDGDAPRFQGHDFCAAQVARALAANAAPLVERHGISVAVVFACQEFESWLIAGIDTLGGVELPEGRGVVPSHLQPPEADLEETPRDAKGWLRANLPAYRQTLDQAALAANMDLEVLAKRMRSYRRLEHAIAQLVAAVRENQPSATPSRTDPN